MLMFVDKLVYDYINGEELENIDELENDYKFMMKVISITKDKNMYSLCSPEVKFNYEFVKFMIETFKCDKDFVDKMAHEYFDKVDSNDFNARELYFIMREIFKDYDDERSIFYNTRCFSIYNADKVMINRLIECEHESFGNDNLGLGFCYIIDYHAEKSDAITKYYAKRFLNEIFYENDKMSLEDLIHSRIRDVSLIESSGIKTFIIDFVRIYDVYLSDYLFAHIDLINELENDISRIINNWDKYNSEMLERKKCIFEQETNGLISKYNVNFDYIDVCCYLDKKVNLPIKFEMSDLDGLFGIDIDKINLVEYRCLKMIIKLAKDLFGSVIIDTEYEYDVLDNTNNVKSRVLEFVPDKNKI